MMKSSVGAFGMYRRIETKRIIYLFIYSFSTKAGSGATAALKQKLIKS